MAFKNALPKVLQSAAKFMFLPILVGACAFGNMSMKPANDVTPPTAQKAKAAKANEMRLVDESYQLKRMKVFYNADTKDYSIELMGQDETGEYTGTGRPTQMNMAFAVRTGQAENPNGNSTIVKVEKVAFTYDVTRNNSPYQEADVELTLEPNYYGENKSVATVIPAMDPNRDTENDEEETSEPFEVKTFKFSGKVLVQFIDVGLRSPKGPTNPNIIVSEMKKSRALGIAVSFQQGHKGLSRKVALGDGQQRNNYFNEDIYLTGAQYKLDNN